MDSLLLALSKSSYVFSGVLFVEDDQVGTLSSIWLWELAACVLVLIVWSSKSTVETARIITPYKPLAYEILLYDKLIKVW